MTSYRTIARLLLAAGVFVLAAIQPSIDPGAVVYAAPSVTITNPSGTTQLGEDLDYATHDWHDAWDMSQESDIYFYVSPTCNSASPMYTSISFSGGIFSGNYNVYDAWFWLLHPGYGGSLHVGKDGFVHPIDASKYTQLTIRMYLDATPPNGMHLRWTDSDTSHFGETSHFGLTKYFQTFQGWNIYTIDLTQIGLIPVANGGGSLTWSGSIRGLALFPADNNPGSNVQIDWIRLSPKVTNTNRTIQWSGSWQSGAGNARAQVYLSTDNFSTVPPDAFYSFSTNPPVSFTTQPDVIPAGANGSSGSYLLPASFLAITEKFRVKITDGTGSTTSSTSPGAWQFNALPPLTFVAPSYESGDDFATKVVGNPWDMSDSADVASYFRLDQINFSNGIMTATSTAGSGSCNASGDPSIFMNMNGQTINTNYYRYATVKIKIDAPFDFGNGWISRWIWGTNSPGVFGYGNDMPLYQNPVSQSYWSIFNVDMWGNVQDDQQPGNLPWLGSSPTYFRFDPLEIPTSTPFEIDYIKLTANDNASHNGVFLVKYILNQSYNATFYYDTDTTPAGRILASPFTPPTPGPLKVFLPLIQTNSGGSGVSGDPPGTRYFNWNLAGIASNYYYVCADVNDTYNTTYWCSDTPMFIKP